MSGERIIDWPIVEAAVWMFLIATVIFLALFRISASARDHELARLGVGGTKLHIHLQYLIRCSDRMGIGLTFAALIFSLVLAFVLGEQLYRDAIQKLVRIMSFR